MARGPLRSLSARITVGVVATVLVIGCGSFWLLQAFYRREMIDSLADAATVHGKLVEQSLRYAMHTRSLDLLAEMVRSLGDQKGVEKVMILDKKGVIRYSSNQAERGRTLTPTDPTCMICHQTDAAVRARTVIFAAGEGRRVFRNVNPILNSDTCFGCHPRQNRVNGVLIVDYSMDGIQASLENGARKMWISALILAVTITAVIVALLRWLVLNRLLTLVRVVDSIEAGQLDGLVPVRGADEITQLSQHLNGMATSLDRSLRDLREREAFLDAVVNSADDGIVVVDEHMQVVKANRAFSQMLGVDPPDACGKPCQCVASCLESGPDGCPAHATFETGEVTHRVRTVAVPNGAERTYEISCSPIHLDGATRQVIEVWRDITHRREIEAQLANSDRLASLGLLAAGVSHEINNPLASITTCLDGLGRRMRQHEGGGPPVAELTEYLDLIRREVVRCGELTGRLKVLGRRPRVTLQAVDVGAAIRDTLALVRYLAEDGKVAIELDAAADVPLAGADEQQVRQVVLNLVLNALQAVEGPGWVRVSTLAGEGGTVVIEVADSGIGIQTRELSRIFEPFYSSRPDGRGSGLGLFITKIIVEQFGGSITVTSTPGEGTRFTVVLPSAPPAAAMGQP